MQELNFQLHVEDGWPPVAVESLPYTRTPRGYRIEVPPIFVKGVSVGDIVLASPDDENRVWEWDFVEKSAHSTIWIARLKRDAQINIDKLMQDFKALGCSSTGSNALGCYAVDVPPERDMADIDELLEKLDTDKIAIAYPSFRHEEDV